MKQTSFYGQRTFFNLRGFREAKKAVSSEKQSKNLSKLSSLNQANRDMQAFVDSNTFNNRVIPLAIICEEMYRTNFIFDKWLKRGG